MTKKVKRQGGREACPGYLRLGLFSLILHPQASPHPERKKFGSFSAASTHKWCFPKSPYFRQFFQLNLLQFCKSPIKPAQARQSKNIFTKSRCLKSIANSSTKAPQKNSCVSVLTFQPDRHDSLINDFQKLIFIKSNLARLFVANRKT